ncbi:glucose-6-phosphate isomerase [Demequina sp. TTPB684]|uniref:glucose-6-phosphate isomerase n=1 Tax=unclassified Demequina TaxID=2620311 RepID=UPI001CF15225|nr:MULTISPECIES: glucose-6-phosphate isomerase [unclassified Demequina]MCB2411648.1 glucose-6-phosphate isomerase [Demequina sp. TTPB684]UPU89336.1 glucose-6-phosphate isomerase [Demequina sp. TMPB413]
MSTFLSTWVGLGDEAHLAVTVAGDAAEAASVLTETMVADKVASRIALADPTLWGPLVEESAATHLGWVAAPYTSRSLVSELEDLYSDVRGEGLTRVVLVGVGGSAVSAGAICATYGVPLTVVDSTEPTQLRSVLEHDLESTLVVACSAPEGTVEAEFLLSLFEEALEESGLDPRRHLVAVADQHSALHRHATDVGYRAVFTSEPTIGDRFSALSAATLVPVALAGVPVSELLDEAEAVADSLAEDHAANPAIVLGAAMGGAHRRYMVLSDHDSGLVGFADWVEQLIASSTGKDGVGIVPVVAEADAADTTFDGTLDTRFVPLDFEGEPEGHAIWVAGTLGGQILLWEYATAIAGRLLGINPFDAPRVESATQAAIALLDAPARPDPFDFVDGSVGVTGSPGLLDGVQSLDDAVAAITAAVPAGGYLALVAFLNSDEFSDVPGVRARLSRKVGIPVTFGWGPRYQHCVGQVHKGGPAAGAFIQMTGSLGEDMEIPGRPFTFGQVMHAQAVGDANVLINHNRPLLRLTVSSPSDVARVISVLGG